MLDKGIQHALHVPTVRIQIVGYPFYSGPGFAGSAVEVSRDK
jgi:hypothetical protein